ncbi:MAG: aconitate hydratase AcnA [Acidimicrobiales bacterium]
MTSAPAGSSGTGASLRVGDRSLGIWRLDAVDGDVDSLPFCLKVLLENLLRHDSAAGGAGVEAVTRWDPGATPSAEIALCPARILLQDFTGVPAVADLAALRDALAAMGGDPSLVNPSIPAELVIDHSIVADHWGVPDAFGRNAAAEYSRNEERYRFLRWGQAAFGTLRVVPPNTGICHQVNLEYLARVVVDGGGSAYPDTVLGTDSHTTMVNGLGVLGWGVGGIEAEAAMLGQPVSMLVPRVVGFKLTGSLPEGATATDLVLTVTEVLRRRGVVGQFVEFYGDGVGSVPVANRATIANMSPEYGSTCAVFPIDSETLAYLRVTGRPEGHVALVEAYAKEQGLWHEPDRQLRFSETVELDLATVVPCLAGPARPQDRVRLDEARRAFRSVLPAMLPGGARSGGGGRRRVPVELADGTSFDLGDGDVVIAAITSCTNTSNPWVMIGAGLLARNAVHAGLSVPPWVKTTLAPGSQVVTGYYDRSGLTPYLDKLGFALVGYGCTTCIGNSGPLRPEVSEAVGAGGLAVVSVLSGNRNFEGRINPEVRMNYLASPPLVVAYALAGTMDVDLTTEPLGSDPAGRPVYLRDIWPTNAEVDGVVQQAIQSDMFRASYASVFTGDERWRALGVPASPFYPWDGRSSYVRRPPFLDGLAPEPAPLTDVSGARVLVKLGDSITTDHISPAGSVPAGSPAGRWLVDGGADPGDLSSYGSRRGNHEVMVRGTFASGRLRNQLAGGAEGGITVHWPDGETMPIFDAAMAYRAEGVALVVLAGREYGSGSSRDWAAKGTALLGVRAVLAESFERIHRSNLVGMGVLPLEYPAGTTAATLGLSGEESFDIAGLEGHGAGAALPEWLEVTASGGPAGTVRLGARLRIDTPMEAEYFRHGGILPYVARTLLARSAPAGGPGRHGPPPPRGPGP